MTDQKLLVSKTPVIENLFLILSSGVLVDLAPILVELNVYEDIFSPVLTGDITILDDRGLFMSEPLNGSERLVYKVYSYDYDPRNDNLNFLHRTFDILKITDVVSVSDTVKKYTLHFASPELKMNETIRISKGFQQVRLSKVVDAILTGDYSVDNPTGLEFPVQESVSGVERNLKSPYLYSDAIEAWYKKDDDFDSVECFIEKSKYTEPVYSFPYKTPFEIIADCCAKAIREAAGRDASKELNQQPNFLFFENKRGFQFVSIDTLLESKEYATTEFVYGDRAQNMINHPDELSVPRRVINRETINRIEVQECFDVLSNIRSGMYASKMYSLDLMRGRVEETNYSYTEDFKNTETTESGSAKNHPSISKSHRDLAEKYLSHRIFSVESPSRYLDIFTSDSTQRKNTAKKDPGISEYIQRRISYLARLNNFRLLFEIDGNSKHKVGDCPFIDIRQAITASGSSLNDIIQEPSKYYSGNYLITSIRHNITPSSYRMFVEAVKDSHQYEIE